MHAYIITLHMPTRRLWSIDKGVESRHDSLISDNRALSTHYDIHPEPACDPDNEASECDNKVYTEHRVEIRTKLHSVVGTVTTAGFMLIRTGVVSETIED